MSVSEIIEEITVGVEWLPIGGAADVPLLEGRSVIVNGRRLAVFRLPDGWTAIDHVCPHRGGPLSDGIVADECVTCPLHNHRFSLRTGEREDAAGEGVQAYVVRERSGRLELQWPADGRPGSAA